VSRAFVHRAQAARVRFGVGTLDQLAEEVDAVGLTRVLVICGPTHQELGRRVATLLGDRVVAVLPEARMHVPVEVAGRVGDVAASVDADGCVAVGGGSAVGLGKALALERGLPVVAVPTTYAGSEMTPVWGLTEAGVKRTGREPRVQPVAVVYDPALTLTMPPDLTATSGLNALAHAVEGLYAPDASPITSMMAEEGARAFAAALPALAVDGTDLEARADALYGAWLCGSVLGSTTMGLHHKLCHVLGGTFDLPHAETHAVILPHAVAFNEAAVPDLLSPLAKALGTERAGQGLHAYAASIGAPMTLKEIALMALFVGMAPSRSHRGSSPPAWPSARVLPGPCASPDSWGDFWWRHHESGASIL
jgi:maleylacetate reductase